MENKKVESTHGTPPATGIASFRSTTTTCNIPLISIDVKQHFVSHSDYSDNHYIEKYSYHMLKYAI